MLGVKVNQYDGEGNNQVGGSSGISVSVNVARRPTIKRVSRPAYEQKMPGEIADHQARKSFSLTIYGLPLPNAITKDLFPGLTENRADELGLNDEQRHMEYLDFSLLDKSTAKHLHTILQIWEDRMPQIENCEHSHFFDQGYLRFAIPDHLEWFDRSGRLISKTVEDILQEYASKPEGDNQTRATVRLTVGINAEENMENPHYVWGLSQILIT